MNLFRIYEFMNLVGLVSTDVATELATCYFEHWVSTDVPTELATKKNALCASNSITREVFKTSYLTSVFEIPKSGFFKIKAS